MYDQGYLARYGADVEPCPVLRCGRRVWNGSLARPWPRSFTTRSCSSWWGPGGGKLGDIAKGIFGEEARQVADLMAAQIRANGSTFAEVAEHMRNTPIDAPR